MKIGTEGRRKVEQYLTGETSLFALNDWSLEFGDDPSQAHDADSMELAGLITELVHDLGSGAIDEPSIRKRLASEVNHRTAPHQRSV
jgi:hypothetical protein